MQCQTIEEEIAQSGFALIRNVMGREEQEALRATLGQVEGAGQRGLLKSPAVSALAFSERWLGWIRPHLPAEPHPVRAIYFDKSIDANWGVAWHQDLTIALHTRTEAAGFGPWSVKDGVPHVQPPAELLEQMLTVRLHLDDADETNGALRVVPGSHRLGRLTAERVQEVRTSRADFLCTAKAGDVLLMRPLLLHASYRSTSTLHRRVLHIEYAGFALPETLRWAEGS